jgi:ornithine cyclodeaminase/alanine dehydrogenase-like protein (mu-crystallin family)
LIKRTQIEAAFNMSDYIAAIEEAFALYGKESVQMPTKAYLPLIYRK